VRYSVYSMLFSGRGSVRCDLARRLVRSSNAVLRLPVLLVAGPFGCSSCGACGLGSELFKEYILRSVPVRGALN